MNNGYFSFEYPNLHANYITRKGLEQTNKMSKNKDRIIFVDVDDVSVWLDPPLKV